MNGRYRGYVLYLIPFLHQTTTMALHFPLVNCCILFHFYIKPQLCEPPLLSCYRCILFHFYIKPQPDAYVKALHERCILFHFYIKPQRFCWRALYPYVVSYSISTSNHNREQHWQCDLGLYLIPFLHQTTTRNARTHVHI